MITPFQENNAKEAFQSDSFNAVLKAEAMTRELLIAMSVRDEELEGDDCLSINDLRLILHDLRLDIDGTKEMLLGRVEEEKKKDNGVEDDADDDEEDRDE